MGTKIERSTFELSVKNIGGIDETQVSITPGITILSGRNATNRTSFLQAIMAALGSNDVSLKGDADEGEVELRIGDETYTRRLYRRSGALVTEGDPYLDDPELADLFSFLIESNEGRRAVARGDDLREIIMRPVDSEAIRAEINELEAEKNRLDSELDELESLSKRLPDLERRRTTLEEEIAEKREEFAEKEVEIDETDASIEETRDEKAKLEEKFDELSSLRSDLETVRRKIDIERNSLDALREERSTHREELDTLPDEPAGDLAEIESNVDRLRGRLSELDTAVNQLQTIIQFNEDMRDEPSNVLTNLNTGEEATSGGAITDQLVDDNVVCWTCGSEVESRKIDRTIEELRDLRQDKLEVRAEIQDRIDEYERRKTEHRDQQNRRERIERQLRGVDEEIEDREARLDELTARRETLSEELETLEGEVEDTEDYDTSAILDLHREANQIEFELDQLEREKDEVEDEIDEIERQLDRRDDLETQRASVNDELEALRTEIDRIERRAVDQFNEHMEAILDILGYENIDRIWIERRETDARDGRRKVTKSTFELHVVRSTDSGTSYEDTIDHLSESEREVTGLVFTLAGYLVHDLHEKVPVMLLDSVEAIDPDRISALVEYFSDYAEHLVIALLPEDAAAFDDEYQRITEI